jgi:hypothetical protein
MEALNLLQIKISPLLENENILDERLRVILNVYLRNTCKISFIRASALVSTVKIKFLCHIIN